MADDLQRLAADLGRVPTNMVRGVEGAIEATLHDVKDDARADAPELSGNYKRSITYERTGMRGEVGPEDWKGHLVEEGGAASPANPVMARAAKKNEDTLERRVADAALKAFGW